MEQIALIIDWLHIYWSQILTALAAAVAICVYLAVLFSDGQGRGAASSVPVAVFLSLIFARLIHWYCRADQYENLLAAVTDLRNGGFALAGVFAGCILTAILLRLLGITDHLPRMLDAMAIGGCAGIAVGRLACFFNAQDRGMLLTMMQSLPWAYPVKNPVSGVEELRLATFFLQAIFAGGLFLALLIFWLCGRKRKTLADGDVSLTFLLCYGVSQVILDSTRYDSLYFRSNGFVSIVQVFSALAIAIVAVIFSVRLVRQRGFRKWYLALWFLLAGLIGIVGFMEYFVQRWSRRVVIGYNVMAMLLAGIVAVVLLIRHLAVRAEQKRRRMLHQTTT